MEALEDALWETNYPSFAHEDYFNIKINSVNKFTPTKPNLLYNSLYRFFTKSKLLNNLTNFGNYNLSIFSENFLPKINLLNVNYSIYFNNNTLFENLEDLYENSKFINLQLLNMNKNIYNNATNYLNPMSYATVFNFFRSSFEESNWFNSNIYQTNNLLPMLQPKYNLLTNNIKLRSTAKNLIVTYNAIQKVYKSRFDEGQSNINFQDVTNTFIKYPFLTETKSPYESTLGKNKEAFYLLNLYNKNINKNLSFFKEITNSFNFIFTNIPFLLSLKSDASRYL